MVRAYLKLAEERTEAAKESSQQMVLDIEDLDNIQTPERYGGKVKLVTGSSDPDFLCKVNSHLLCLQCPPERCEWGRHSGPNRPAASYTMGEVSLGIVQTMSGSSTKQLQGGAPVP